VYMHGGQGRHVYKCVREEEGGGCVLAWDRAARSAGLTKGGGGGGSCNESTGQT
jgi:hypothetical protein